MIPRRNSQCDVWSLPLVPFEAFVLSSVNGESDIVELSEIVGAPLFDVHSTLRRLEVLGAVIVDDDGWSERPTVPGERPSQRPTVPSS